MTKITENTIEEFAIELLERFGAQHLYATNIAPDFEGFVSRVERKNSYEDVLLTEKLQNAIYRGKL